MKEWARITHDFDNFTREWIYRKELQDVRPTLTSLGVHALDSGSWYSLSSIVWANHRYAKAFDEVGPSEAQILMDLEELERLGLVISRDRHASRG